MKTYKEVAENVFQRGEVIIAKKQMKRKKAVRAAGCAVCVCAAIVMCMGLFDSPVFIDIEPTASTSETTSVPKNEKGEILYSNIVKSSKTDESILNAAMGSTMCIAAFNENFLDRSAAIVEGEIISMRVKEYSYLVPCDKFSEDGTLLEKPVTVIYELATEKVWCGDIQAGETVVIEDMLYFTEEIFLMKIGHSYVIPLCNSGNKIYEGEVISGDVTRESNYSTVYTFHPQIEVTESGYIVSGDWETLIDKSAEKIVMDIELGETGEYYKDKMYLLSKTTFNKNMEKLIKRENIG